MGYPSGQLESTVFSNLTCKGEAECEIKCKHCSAIVSAINSIFIHESKTQHHRGTLSQVNSMPARHNAAAETEAVLYVGCTLLWCQGDSALWWMELSASVDYLVLSSVRENCVSLRTRCNFSVSAQGSISAAFGRSDWRVHQKISEYTSLVTVFYTELLTPSFSVLLVFGKYIF